jgi:hypothetical protein
MVSELRRRRPHRGLAAVLVELRLRRRAFAAAEAVAMIGATEIDPGLPMAPIAVALSLGTVASGTARGSIPELTITHPEGVPPSMTGRR